jgi:hypothetical protein
MPPIAPLPRPALGDEALQHYDVPSVPPISAPASILQGTEVELPEPSPRQAERNNIETSKSVPKPIPGPPRAGPQSTLSRVAIRAPEALRSFVSGVPREHSIHKIAEETTRMFIPRTLLNRTAGESSEQPEKNISLPRTAHRIPVQHEASQPTNSMDEAAAVKAPVPRIAHEEVPEYVRDAKRSVVSPRNDLQSSVRMTPSPAMPVTEIRRLPPAQPAESRRRAQISIGRIDVQVNNQAPQPAAPQPSRAAARMNSLEQRYLGRFFINL